MNSLATKLGFDWNRLGALQRLLLWLLLSASLHAALIQYAPAGTSWGCCSKSASATTSAAMPTALNVTFAGALVVAAESALKTGPIPTPSTESESVVGDDLGSRLLPSYFTTQELSSKPQPIDEIRIADPSTIAGVASGNLVLELFINEAGGMDRVEIESASLPESFQKIAADAFRQAKFTPGIKDGILVKSRLRIEINVEDVPRTTDPSVV